MSSQPEPQPIIQVVGPTDDWILERLARRLVAKLPYAEFLPWEANPRPATAIVYYINYALFLAPSNCIDVGFFTHQDDDQQFLERAQRVDYCVCMSMLYADRLRQQGIQKVIHIPIGFDAYRYRPHLLLGVVGRLDHPRKGKELVERIRSLPFVEVITTEGQLKQEELWAFYQWLDYVLIPALVEGGPLSLLEGLAMGKPVIAPDGVGLVPEFGNCEHILRYPAGDGEALSHLVTICYQQKLQRRRLVEDRNWDRWAEDHHQFFARILAERGRQVPVPGPSFRFGMMAELDIPRTVHTEALEAKVDQAAWHLYFSQTDQARSILNQVVQEFPFAELLRDSIPERPSSNDGSQAGSAITIDESRVVPVRLSLIVTVLESYEIVRRQLVYLERILPQYGCELIVVDDGSNPSLQATCDSVKKSFPFLLHFTQDRRPWTQSRARNIGADLAQADRLLLFDIDHIITQEIIENCLDYNGDKLHWMRHPGILDEEGQLITDVAVLKDYGLNDSLAPVHSNSFMIRRDLFEKLAGYDERFCGRYGGDDIDFNNRYEELCSTGVAQNSEILGNGYVFPDPASVKEWFHSLERVPRPGSLV